MYLAGKKIKPGTGHAEGRVLLAQMYGQYVGGVMPAIALTERGKPYFVGSPWQFSISHTKGHVFCALSQSKIGIDAEETDRNIRPELADQILSPMERQQFDRAEDQRLALLTFWVLKEARAKMTGEGIRFHPNQTNFSLEDSRVVRLQDCLVAVIEEEDHAV